MDMSVGICVDIGIGVGTRAWAWLMLVHAHGYLQVLSIRWFYDVLLEKLGGGALNPASTSTFKKLMKALSYLMGQRRVYVPKALTREIIEAVCSTVRVGSVDEMTAASVLVADFVWGARGADLYLADWSELVFELEAAACEEAARIIGLTWKRLQTKNDRQGRKDAPKPLQCSAECNSRLYVTKDGRLDGIPCPVHLMEAVRALQADDVCVPCDELVGPWLGTYVLPVDATTGVLSGTTVAAVDVDAMNKRVAPTVKVISQEEEEKGVRYDGSRDTATPAMLQLKKLPRARGTMYEVPKLASGAKPVKSYVVRAFGDAKGVTSKLRGLVRKEAAAARKAGRAPAVADVKSIASRSLRSGAATALADLPPDVRMGQLDHSDLGVSNGYVQRHVQFKKGALNLTDTALQGTQPTEVQAQQLTKALMADKDSQLEILQRENERLKMALGLQGATGATLDIRLGNALAASAVLAAPAEAAMPGAEAQAALLALTEVPNAEPVETEPPMPEAGSKRPLGESAPKAKKVRGTDRKPCSQVCEQKGLVDERHDWNALKLTVEECIDKCCTNGSLTAGRLQTALCNAQVHTRKKMVTNLLERQRKSIKAATVPMLTGVEEMILTIGGESC